MTKIVKEFIEALNAFNNKTAPYDTKGTVKRVEGKTAWVRLSGGIDETPVEKTINCVAGDIVQVRVGGGRAWITGNLSKPPTDDTVAKYEEDPHKAMLLKKRNILIVFSENCRHSLILHQNSASECFLRV